MAGRWTYVLLVVLLCVLGTVDGDRKERKRKGWPSQWGWGSEENRQDKLTHPDHKYPEDHPDAKDHDHDDSDDDDDDNDSHEKHDKDEYDHHRHHGGKHHHHHHDHRHHKWNWGHGVGLLVLIIIICVLCGLLSLMTWLSCKIYRKCKKGDTTVVTNNGKPLHSNMPPAWSSQLVFQPEMSAGFGLVSDGFARVGPSHLIRKRQDARTTDGASWAVAMTKGKHVFEITWPWAHRGSNASIGVGTSEAPIKGKGSYPLVGSNDHTWGLDIVGRKVRHSNRPVVNCPTDGSYVPDKFLMFVNVDEGRLGFGNDVTYWGDVITNLPKHGKKPLHVMVGASRWHAEINVQYKGSAIDGGNDEVKQGLPHHLPPLSNAPLPPIYTELDESNKEPIMVAPICPPIGAPTDDGGDEVSIKPGTPPPPYAHNPVGYRPDNRPETTVDEEKVPL